VPELSVPGVLKCQTALLAVGGQLVAEPQEPASLMKNCTFGTPGRRARGGAGKREREERRPTGPIPVKVTGRVYNVDGVDEVEDESIEEFDDFATSLPKDDEATSSPNDDEADEEE